MLRVTLSARLEEVDGATVAVRNEAARELSEPALIRLEIAVTEALTNIVRHGYSKPGGQIHLTCGEHGDGFVVTISDAGRRVPEHLFTSPAHLPDDPLQESGRGVALILACADVVDYRRLGGRNELSMVFLSNRPAESRQAVLP